MFIVPDQCKNEIEGLEHLVKCLNHRFNGYPVVFMGTLKDAVKEAFNQKDIGEVREWSMNFFKQRLLFENLASTIFNLRE